MATTKQISTQISWRIIAVVMGVQILSIAIGIRLVLAHTNVLGNNANWIISKNELNFPGYDGSVFRDYPPAVAEEALNPAAWRGYHEVLSKDSFDWKEFSFKFQPSDHGYLYVIFDRSQDTFNALRFSFNPLYRPALIRAKYTGEFISQENLPSLPYTSALWQDFRLQRSETDLTTYTFLLNNQLVTTFKASASTKTSATQIGFREGQKPVLIDSVRVWGKNKQLLLADNFDHQENFWPYLGLASAALLAINRIIFLLLQSHYLVVKKYFQLLFVLSFFLLIFCQCRLTVRETVAYEIPRS